MKTLTASAPDRTAMAMNATAKLWVTPSTIVNTPNNATTNSSVLPTRCRSGRRASTIVTAAAPMPPAARSHPRPTAST